MKERYWAMYTDMKYKECYYFHYSTRSRKINNSLTAINAIFSATSIASWAVWDFVPWAWAILVILLQVLQALTPIFPFSKQLASFKFFLPQLSELLLDVDTGWRNIDEYSEKKINSLISKAEKQFNSLENQYIPCEDFPVKKRCADKATKDYDAFFYHHYNVLKEE